jgi:PIN domain nuclease of toxin-antitoxin system
MMRYILDACALITLFQRKPGFDVVQDILDRASRGKAMIYMSLVNLLEVAYHFARIKSYAEMDI